MSTLVKKSKSSYLWREQTNQATHKCRGKKSKSSYLQGGRMNQATHECPGKKSKSSYLQGGWTEKPSRQRMPW